MSKYAIGIDIGGTNTVIGVVNEEGKVVEHSSLPTPKDPDVSKYIDQLSTVINSLALTLEANFDGAKVAGIGIGAPNANFYTGSIEEAPNLAFEGVVPLVALLKEKVAYDNITLTNDANAAAIGEMIYGGAKGMKNFVMITLGTGLGSGIVVNGELVYGADGFAGEIGHTTIIPDGRDCGCGHNGHLEAYCSAPGIKRTCFELLAHTNDTESELANVSFNEMTSKMVFDAAENGDKVAIEAFNETGAILGEALANTTHHLSPEAIFLFGGPTAAGDHIFKPTKEAFENSLLPMFKGKIKILKSELESGSAAIVGASALVWG